MKETLNIETERVDDIPLLLAHMQHMNLANLLDKRIPVHGNQKGLELIRKLGFGSGLKAL
jgi:hypothetical protein